MEELKNIICNRIEDVNQQLGTNMLYDITKVNGVDALMIDSQYLTLTHTVQGISSLVLKPTVEEFIGSCILESAFATELAFCLGIIGFLNIEYARQQELDGFGFSGGDIPQA